MNSKQQLMGSSCISKVMWWQQHLCELQCGGIAVNCKVSLFYIVVAHSWLCNSHFWKRSPWLSLLAKNGNSLAKYVSFIVSQHINCVAATISEKAPGNPFMLKMTNIWLQNWVFLWQKECWLHYSSWILEKRPPVVPCFQNWQMASHNQLQKLQQQRWGCLHNIMGSAGKVMAMASLC